MRFLPVILVLLLLPAVFAADPGHPASGVGAGVFEAGDFYFNGSSILIPATPQNTSSFALSSGVRSVASRGSLAFVGYDSSGNLFSVVDYADPSSPQLLGTLAIPGGSVLDVELLSNYAFLAVDGNATRALTVVNVTNPANISEVSTLTLDAGAQDIVLSGAFAFVAIKAPGPHVQVVDISDPASPVVVGSLALSDEANSLALVNGLLYVATSSTGDDVQVVDVSDPLNPAIVGGFEAGGSVSSLDFFDGVLYAATSGVATDVLYALDVTNSSAPASLGSFNLTGASYDVRAFGDYVFVATDNSSQELVVVDVTVPSSMSEVFTYDLVDTARSLGDLRENLLVGTQGTGNDLHVLDVGSLRAPFASFGSLVAQRISSSQLVADSIAATSGVSAGSAGFFTTGPIVSTDNVSAPMICLNGDCQSSWPAGGSSLWTNSSGDATYTAGDVGIGTTTPRQPLEVFGAITENNQSTSNQYYSSGDFVLNFTPSLDDNGLVYRHGVRSTVNIPASATGDTHNTHGIRGVVDYRGSGTASRLYGSSGWANVVGATATRVTGLYGYGTVQSSSDVGWLYGVYGEAFTLSSTTDNSYGGYFTSYNSSGTLNNSYGVYIGQVSGTSEWGLYQSDASNTNYFGGDVGIGTTTPSHPLHVLGPASSASAYSLLAEYQDHVGNFVYTPLGVKHTYPGGQVGDGTSVAIAFKLEDTAAVDNNLGNVGFRRTGADNSGMFFVQTQDGGDLNRKFMIWPSGEIGINLSSSANPQQSLVVDGTVNATAFVGDGSGLTGISGSGIWTNVSGTATFDGDANVTGTIYYGGNLTGYGADFAERLTMAEPVEPSDVVCLNEKKEIFKCRSRADPSVVGVVSTHATIIGNAAAPNSVPVGIVGLVPTRIKGPIAAFELVTSSDTPGVAEKASIDDFGAIIGKTMQACSDEECVIDVVVGLR